MRFFAAAPDLSHRFLARLTQIDYAREMAFVAIDERRASCSASPAWSPIPTTRRAEYAVLVRSDLKGRGLGWRLMQHLIAYARAERLDELHGAVLAENTTMLQMCRELGFSADLAPHYRPISRQPPSNVKSPLSADHLLASGSQSFDGGNVEQ